MIRAIVAGSIVGHVFGVHGNLAYIFLSKPANLFAI